MSRVLLSLVVPPALEESFVDRLLSFEPPVDFVSLPVDAHRAGDTEMSVVEQVTGRRQMRLFQLELDEQAARAMVQAIAADLPGLRLRYWATPVVIAGRLGP